MKVPYERKKCILVIKCTLNALIKASIKIINKFNMGKIKYERRKSSSLGFEKFSIEREETDKPIILDTHSQLSSSG